MSQPEVGIINHGEAIWRVKIYGYVDTRQNKCTAVLKPYSNIAGEVRLDETVIFKCTQSSTRIA